MGGFRWTEACEGESHVSSRKNFLKSAAAFVISTGIGASLTIAAFAQTPAGGAPATTPPPAGGRAALPPPPPIDALIKGAHWHDITINTTDPAKAIAFYTRQFKARPATWNGQPAVWAQKSWLLFNKVSKPASTAFNTAIWHIGWGAPDPKAAYAHQVSLGASFAQPITDISTGLRGFRPDQFYYMYVATPEHTMVELNTAATDNFDHIHMFSLDPVSAGDWYMKTFGVRGRLSTPQTNREPVYSISVEHIQVGPSSSINFDNVNMIIYPVEYATKSYASDWTNVKAMQTTRGQAFDHIGVSVPDVDLAVKLLRGQGTKIVSGVRKVNDKLKVAWIEGPDHIAIELLQDETDHPPLE